MRGTGALIGGSQPAALRGSTYKQNHSMRQCELNPYSSSKLNTYCSMPSSSANKRARSSAPATDDQQPPSGDAAADTPVPAVPLKVVVAAADTPVPSAALKQEQEPVPLIVPPNVQPPDSPLPEAPPLQLGAAVAAPAGNRARFMSCMQPAKISCDLTTVPVSPGMRFSFEAIVAVVYPAKMSPPERRYVELMDEHGTTGITIWNSYVHAIRTSTVGCVVKFTRLAITVHNGKKSLTMGKDSTMHVEAPDATGRLPLWWKQLLETPRISCIEFHDMPSARIVNVAGVLGFICQEEKIVNGEPKLLLIMIITDRTGKIEIRSWNHSDAEFLHYKERPILLKRVRVCQYAGTRTGELLTGDNGSRITTAFDSEDLQKYWAE